MRGQLKGFSINDLRVALLKFIEEILSEIFATKIVIFSDKIFEISLFGKLRIDLMKE